MKRTWLAMLVATTALIPCAAVAQSTNEAAPQQQAAPQTESGEAQALTVASLSNQTLFDQSGQELGRISNVVRGQGDQMFVVVATQDNRQVLVPVDRVSFSSDRFTFEGSTGELAEYREGSDYQPVEQNQEISLAGAQMKQGQAQGEGAQITVQQPQPSVQVQQAAPQVTVQQPQPQITVRQPNPQILVRQPAPTITVDIPPPEIIVRMPRPDVNVAMAKPQVEVRQPQPQVQIQQPQEQPSVEVQEAQPQVQVQQGQAQVSLEQQGQPQIQYERAEPRVVINQDKAQPKVTFEQLDAAGDQTQAASQQQQPSGEQAQAPAQAQETQQQPKQTQQQQTAQTTEAQQQTAQTTQPQQPQEQALAGADQQQAAQDRPAELTAEQRQAYLERFGGESTAARGEERQLQASAIEEMDVWNTRGEQIGQVEDVVEIDGKAYVIVSHGGFLGIGESRVAFPIERFALSGENHLVISGVTEQDIEAMSSWQNGTRNFTELQGDRQLRLPELQPQQ